MHGVFDVGRTSDETWVTLLASCESVFTIRIVQPSRSGFFDAVVASGLPLDPPLVRVTDVWDALSSSLSSGLVWLDGGLVGIRCEGFGALGQASPGDASIARDIFEDLVAAAPTLRLGGARALSLCVLLLP